MSKQWYRLTTYIPFLFFNIPIKHGRKSSVHAARACMKDGATCDYMITNHRDEVVEIRKNGIVDHF